MLERQLELLEELGFHRYEHRTDSRSYYEFSRGSISIRVEDYGVMMLSCDYIGASFRGNDVLALLVEMQTHIERSVGRLVLVKDDVFNTAMELRKHTDGNQD